MLRCHGRRAAYQSADIDFRSGGVAQYIDAASTLLFLRYQHASGDALIGENVDLTNLDALQQDIRGVRVNF